MTRSIDETEKDDQGEATDWLRMGIDCNGTPEILLLAHTLGKILDPKVTNPTEALRQMEVLREAGVIGDKK